jgi:hypothetical protein
LGAFVESKLRTFLICKVDELFSNNKAIDVCGRGYVDIISISFYFAGENYTMDLPLAFLIAITSLLKSVTI